LKSKRSLLLRILKWTGITVGGTLFILIFLVAPYWLANTVTTFGTRPMDQELTSTPADYGVEFEEVVFASTDGVALAGWYLGDGNRGASVVCAHGLFRSRLEVLERAVFLRQNGFNVLLFDSRRHGASGGDRITLGFKERLDVEAGIRFVKDRSPADKIILFGVSMGAAASLLAAAETPDVLAVIADSSFLNFEHIVTHHLKLLFGLPRFPLGDELVFFIERLAGFSKEDFDLETAVGRVGNRPILFIAGSEDERTPVALQERLFRAAESEKSDLVVLDGATHGAAYRTRTEAYRNALLSFLSKAAPVPHPSAEAEPVKKGAL